MFFLLVDALLLSPVQDKCCKFKLFLVELGQSRIQSPQASWSAGGAWRDSGVMEKSVIFLIGCSGLFTVTKLRTVNRRIPAVTIPLSQSLSWHRPLTKKPEDSGYEIELVEIKGFFILTGATMNSRKLAHLAANHWS